MVNTRSAKHGLVPIVALSHAADYTFGFYPYGFRGRNPEGDSIVAVQTNRYGLVINASKARIDRLGPLVDPLTAEQAAAQGNEILWRLPATSITFELNVGGEVYQAVGAAPAPDDVILVELGKYRQHVQVGRLAFKRLDGTPLAPCDASLDLYCWSDRLSITLQITAPAKTAPLENVVLTAKIEVPDAAAAYGIDAAHQWQPIIVADVPHDGVALVGGDGHGLAVLAAPGENQLLALAGERRIVASTAPTSIQPGVVRSLSLILVPSPGDVLMDGLAEATEMRTPLDNAGILATDAHHAPCRTTYSPVEGVYEIDVDEYKDVWHDERIHLTLVNAELRSRTIRLNFAKHKGYFGSTGMSPVLTDKKSLPIGLPVQISKDWHVDPPWFHGLTMIHLEPQSRVDLGFVLAYANWGGVPAVSHAQLSLLGYGYGGNQQWDQVAIGSFGESICYDPDVNLRRSMIDDMRPLMVWGLGATPKKKWDWTNNVGGGDFLVLFTGGQRQFLTRQKTVYSSYCPALSDVSYVGETPGGAIQSSIRTQSWRSDDYVRARYVIRYDVTAPVEHIERLAFFQLGADHYNDNRFQRIARGDLDGMQETWRPVEGGWEYSRKGIPLDGRRPWLAAYRTTREPQLGPGQGALANRGLIVRSWKARLNGIEQPHPFYSVYGTGNPISAIIEIAPPPDLDRLLPGDFVEMELVMLIVPQQRSDYYGPNDALREALGAYPDSWELIYREVLGEEVVVSASIGTVEQAWPVRVKAQDGRQASFTIEGGSGYAPVTITDAAGYGPFVLEQITPEGPMHVAGSGSGNVSWQADYHADVPRWDLTFTLPFDSMGDRREKRHFAWRLL